MGMLSRLRERGEAFVARRLQGEAVAFSAAIPGSAGPLCELTFEAAAEPEADGERVRARMHLRLSLRRPPALSRGRGFSPDPSRLKPLPQALPARVGRWIERRLASRLVQTLATPLLDRNLHSWVEVRSSSASLDEGSRELVPERLDRLGIKPEPGKPIQTWAGGLGGTRAGFATLTLMQIDKDRLPPALQQALGPKPLHITATMASVIEEA
jgi:hypothetical protein